MIRIDEIIAVCQHTFTQHIRLRCSIGLTPTCINEISFQHQEGISEFVSSILSSSFTSNEIVKKQIIALFLYTSNERKRDLAMKILSMNFNDYHIFLLISHALFLMDITNMEREGTFYNYITSILRITINNTNKKSILMGRGAVLNANVSHMNTFLNDFSHFLDLFIN